LYLGLIVLITIKKSKFKTTRNSLFKILLGEKKLHLDELKPSLELFFKDQIHHKDDQVSS